MHPLTTWLALVGSVWALFALAEERLLPMHRADITRWLRGQTPHWAAPLVAVWDSVFGTPGVSSVYVLRAGMASQIAAFLVLGLSGVLYPGTSGVMLLLLFLYAPFLISALALGHLLPGAVSLRLQRGLLHYLSQSQTPARLGVWCACACIATLVLALLACALALVVVFMSNQARLLRSPVTWVVGYVEFVFKSPSGALSALQDAVRLRPIIVPGLAFPSFGIWLYAPCFPLLWVGLYVLSGTLIRYATAWGLMPVPGRAPGLLDIDLRPLHTLGAVAVGIVSAVYWIAVLWRR